MKKKILKVVYWTVGVLLVILTILYFLGVYRFQIENYFRAQRQEKMMAELRLENERIEELQKNDTYGGKTPEETLELYLEALKAGDIELASKYSEISTEKPNLQKEELDGLNKLIQRDGDLHVVLENMDNIINNGKKNIWSDTEVSFVYYYLTKDETRSTLINAGQEIETVYPKGINENIGVSLRLNPYTNVWKIIQ